MSKTLMEYLKDAAKDREILTEYQKVLNTNTKKEEIKTIIKLSKKTINAKNQVIDNPLLINSKLKLNTNYKVMVKSYMVKSDSDKFTFHTTWNNGIEMPLRIMYGKVLEETKTMIKMNLQADITECEYCLKCGKFLTNDVSKLYGLGPECGKHYYINPLTKSEFEKRKEAIKNQLNTITWEGWIPKIAIISMIELEEN